MNTSQKNFMVPLAFVGMMFFAIGFALGINSFLMPVLERSMEMSASESNLLLAATFVPFYKPQNKMFHFCKTFCSKITLVNTIQNVI